MSDVDIDEAPISEDLVIEILGWQAKLKQGEEIVSEALWAEGDLVFAARLTEAQFRKLASRTKVDKDTLHDREHLARVFPPARRNLSVSWSVHKVLARIDDEAVQDMLLQRDDWTVESMRREVRKYLRKTGAVKDDVPAFRAGMSVGGIKVTGRRVGDRIEISVEAPSAGKPQMTTTRSSVTLTVELNEKKLRSVS